MELREVVERAVLLLSAMSDEESAKALAPGKWSASEIIGHLIDSASNNHQRFVRAQFQTDLVFPGYAQEDWVRVQDYRNAPWRELLTLWHSYNLQLARVMAAVPEEIRVKEHRKHNLHRIAWQTVPEDEPATLDYLMRDYVGHLKNHLRQILGDPSNKTLLQSKADVGHRSLSGLGGRHLISSYEMPRAGLEPARPYGQRILSPQRLPVPPPRHRVEDSMP